MQYMHQPMIACIWCADKEVQSDVPFNEPNEPDGPTQHNGYYQT